jgi:uncharacterized protein
VHEFLIFAMIGFVAQLIDGSLGMGYGMISSASLLVAGIPPALASASTHAAKLFTSSTSALSHFALGNVDRRIFWKLAILGSIGGIIGAFSITQLNGAAIKPYVMAYLACIGALIIYRALRRDHELVIAHPKSMLPGFIGAAGGFADGIGGGGWGPVTTTSLLATGHAPRFTVGSVNAAEAVVTAAIITAFAVSHFTGVWTGAGDLRGLLTPVAGLIAGGVPAALIAGYLPRRVDARRMSAAVGVLILCIAAQQLWVLLS